MAELLRSLFNVHKLPFKIVVWVALVSGALLFSPNAFLATVKLESFLEKYGGFVGVTFLASTSLVIINAVSWLGGLISEKARHQTWERNLQDVLTKLDPSEQAVLREFKIQNKHTITLPMDHATIVGLRTKGIVIQQGTIGTQTLAGILFPYVMAPQAKKRLTNQLMGFPREGDMLTEEEADEISAARPAFVKQIENFEYLMRY